MKRVFIALVRRGQALPWADWEPNPVVVKELRQAMRSWAVPVMGQLFLLVLLGACVLMLAGHSARATLDTAVGRQVFFFFYGVLTWSCLCFIPLYVGVRLASERQPDQLDLLYVSTLSAGQIVRGKVGGGLDRKSVV